MKAALVGYGQMGHMIESLAGKHGIEIIQRYWDERPLGTDEKTRSELNDVETLIDFSVPDAALENIRKGVVLGKQMVIGTTGWFDQIESIRAVVENAGLGLVYASNFSLGVNLFYRIAEHSARLISTFSEYDPFIEEAHHRLKKDAPSGTALEIAKLVESAYPDREIPVSSVRAGYIPGTHILGFDSRVDTLILSHTARSREGFAEGALIAAKWITGKQGLFHFRDVLTDILSIQK